MKGLQGITKGYRESQGIKRRYKVYWGVQGDRRVTGDCKGLMGFPWYRGLQGFAGDLNGLQGITRVYKGFHLTTRLTEYLRVYWGLPGITGDYNG